MVAAVRWQVGRSGSWTKLYDSKTFKKRNKEENIPEARDTSASRASSSVPVVVGVIVVLVLSMVAVVVLVTGIGRRRRNLNDYLISYKRCNSNIKNIPNAQTMQLASSGTATS